MKFQGEGVAAIVGPNGCGKSNVSDAISWVLGEQSAKNLRSGRMQDVIFNGTSGRKATGLAEVHLTLVDPEREASPPSHSSSHSFGSIPSNGHSISQEQREGGDKGSGEIVVSRRLFNSG